MINVSQYEGTSWSSLIVTMAASALFFSKVFGAIADGAPLPPDQIARMGLAIVVIVVAIEVAFRVAVALWCKRQPQTDERDELIAAKSARNAYYILITGLMLQLVNVGIAALFGRAAPVDIDLSMAIVLGVFLLVAAEISHYVSRIVYYRLGA